MTEENSKGLCGKCKNQLEGQQYVSYWRDGYICQRCRLEDIDLQISHTEENIKLHQTHLADLKQRKEKISKNEAEFTSSKV